MAAGEGDGANVKDEDLLADNSAMKTCANNQEIARNALETFKSALKTSKLSLAGRDLIEDVLTKTIKVIGRYATMKGLLPTRTSTLPVTELDLSGNSLFNHHGSQESMASSKGTLRRRSETVQLVVQFVRVSTAADVVRLEDCALQGVSHDKDDPIEQEVVRLVKKFGVANKARYTKEVSLAGNKFKADFLKKIVEGAYWERSRHPDKENLPKLHLNLSRNRIQDPDRVLEELRAGRTAGGPINVACTTDPQDMQDKALIKVDLTDQRDRSETPRKDSRRPLLEHLRTDRNKASPPPRRSSPPPRRRSPSPRYSRSPSANARARPSPSRSYSKRRGNSKARGGGGGGGRSRSPSRSPPQATRKGRRQGRGAREGRKRSVSCSEYSRSCNSRSRSSGRGGRKGGGGRRRAGRRDASESRDSRTKRRGGGGGRRRL